MAINWDVVADAGIPFHDQWYTVVTPTLFLIGQILVQTPIKTQYNVIMGLFCTGLMLEFTKDAKLIPLEATAVLASVFRVFCR